MLSVIQAPQDFPQTLSGKEEGEGGSDEEREKGEEIRGGEKGDGINGEDVEG